MDCVADVVVEGEKERVGVLVVLDDHVRETVAVEDGAAEVDAAAVLVLDVEIERVGVVVTVEERVVEGECVPEGEPD